MNLGMKKVCQCESAISIQSLQMGMYFDHARVKPNLLGYRSGEVTSREIHKFVFLDRIIETSRLATAFWVFEVRNSYEDIVKENVTNGRLADQSRLLEMKIQQTSVL